MADSTTNTEQQPKKKRGRRPGSKNKGAGATTSGTILTAELRNSGRDYPSAETTNASPRERMIRGLAIVARTNRQVMQEYGITQTELHAFWRESLGIS